MRIQKCKGTRDLSNIEMTQFRTIEAAFRKHCLLCGYDEIRTPTLEYLHLFTSTGTLTPGQLGKVYSFLDWDGWSGERVVLRPDATIPVARFYIDNIPETELAKLFYITNIFSFESTGKEPRERWQCGAEVAGANSSISDVELITLALKILESLGIKDVELKLSHAGLIKALLAKFGLSPREQATVFDQLLDGDTEAISRLKVRTPKLGKALTPLLDLKGQSPGFLKNLKSLFNHDLPEFEPCLDDFINIVEILDNMGYKYDIDIASGRGFEYYTGIIFQIFAGEERIGGGGRYDDLIPLMGGKDIPASGFALYIDPLMKMIKQSDPVVSHDKTILLTMKDDPTTAREGFSVADVLRKADYIVEMDMGNQNPADYGWTLEVVGQPLGFQLAERTTNRKLETRDVNEILTFLGGDGVDKSSAS